MYLPIFISKLRNTIFKVRRHGDSIHFFLIYCLSPNNLLLFCFSSSLIFQNYLILQFPSNINFFIAYHQKIFTKKHTDFRKSQKFVPSVIYLRQTPLVEFEGLAESERAARFGLLKSWHKIATNGSQPYVVFQMPGEASTSGPATIK